MADGRDWLKKILPGFIVDPLVVYRQHLAVKRLHNSLCRISQDMRPELIQRLRVVPDRVALLEMMPKNGVVAEVGVAEGNFSAAILQICKPKVLHLVDLWSSDLKQVNYNECAYTGVKTRFSREIESGQIVLHRGFSWDVLETFPNALFDWVYIDASHAYESVKWDLNSAHPKVKPSGFIAGHDYTLWGDNLSRWGVVEAVNEFCNERKYEMAYLTHESKKKHSYAIRAIDNRTV